MMNNILRNNKGGMNTMGIALIISICAMLITAGAMIYTAKNLPGFLSQNKDAVTFIQDVADDGILFD